MKIMPFQCPRCGEEIEPPQEAWSITCHRCGKTVDFHGQFAYSRGAGAFEDAIDTSGELDHIKRTRKGPTMRFEYADRERDMFNLFGQAYTALLEGFQFELTDDQHEHSVEMMIHIARQFLPRNMISSLEASYWNSLMVYYTAIHEREVVRERMSKNTLLAKLLRWRWKMRLRQLDEAVVRLDQRMHVMENNIQFAHPVRAYRRKH